MGVMHVFERIERQLSLDALEPQPLAELFGLWKACAGTGAPKACGFPIERVRGGLDHLALIQIRREPFAAEYRIFGAALRRMLGRDPTGLRLDAVYPPRFYADIKTALGAMIERGPQYHQREFVILGRRFGYYRLLLPLEDSSARSTKAMLAVYPTHAGMMAASQWKGALRELMRSHGESALPERLWRDTLDDEDYLLLDC